MRSPSVEKLLNAFRDLDEKDAKLIKRLAREVDNPEKLRATVEKCCPKTASYVRSMHSSPYDSAMWRRTVALDAMDHILGTHGVEALGPGNVPPYEYLNAGDTYATTLIYRRKTDTLSIGCWGDIAEKHPNW